jgi:hypothetical protein
MTTPIAPVAGRLPTFLVIGAMKAGTTSLYHYLRAHPQVFMPPYKAPEFFAGEAHWRRGIEWYRQLFASAGPDAMAIGEASNVYTKYPQYRGVPERIATYIPDARLVYVLRDPVQRIRSHYETRVVEGAEKAPFEEAVLTNPIYLDCSRYAMQLEQYLARFPREQLLVITSEQLRGARHATIRNVYEFIGVDPQFIPPNLHRDFYQTKDKPSRSLIPLSLRKWLKTHVPASKRAKELESNLLRAFNRLQRRPPDDGPGRSVTIPDELRGRLNGLLADDVRRLRALVGPELDGWGIA